MSAQILTAALAGDRMSAPNYFAEAANKHSKVSDSLIEDYVMLVSIAYS